MGQSSGVGGTQLSWQMAEGQELADCTTPVRERARKSALSTKQREEEKLTGKVVLQ